MSGITADFVKMGAGVVMGLFVLIIIYGMVASIGNTACWRNTAKDFNDKLVGISSVNLQSYLGTKNQFEVNFPIENCLKSAWFIESDQISQCGVACQDFGGSSDVDTKCREDCQKKCGRNRGDCIVLVPVRTGKEAPWYKGYKWAAFWVSNNPIVYSGGESVLHFDGLEKINIDWDIGDDELIITKNGKETVESFDNTMERCLLFSSSDMKNYNVEMKECENEEG